VEENNKKLMPSIAFSSLKVPKKCVGGWSSAPDSAGGVLKFPPGPIAEFQGRGKGGERK